MHRWQIVLAVVSAAIAFLFLLGWVVYLLSYFLRDRGSRPGAARQRRGVISDGKKLENKGKIKKVHGQYSFSVEAFRWDHHPSLVAEILEHGWTTFAFTYNYFSREKNNLCGLCRSQGAKSEPEISWEPVPGSNLMQKIRLNPASASSEFVSLHTALPLPGPALGSLGFPQESYFEITIISEGTVDEKNLYNSASFADGVDDDDDGVNLLHLVSLDRNVVAPNEGLRLSDVTGSNENVSAGQRKAKDRIIAVGQVASGSCACTMPGIDLGSLGFYSTGAVLLNGQRPAGSEGEMHKWGNVGSVIGCGFDPASRCVFLTLNGVWVRSVMCATVDFGNPLYPTIAANYDVSVLVNLGQRSFCYEEANSKRVSDPSALNCLEDSREFFSMERIDPLWLADKMPLPFPPAETDESDLFEIALDADAEFLTVR